MVVSHQEASGIAAKDASSKPWMTKHSHLHLQEEVKVMQMMGDDTEVNVMKPKLWSLEISCKCRHFVLQESRNPIQHRVTQLILSTMKTHLSHKHELFLHYIFTERLKGEQPTKVECMI